MEGVRKRGCDSFSCMEEGGGARQANMVGDGTLNP